MWFTTTPPTGWLDCDNSQVSRATYPQLNAAAAADGYKWGAGDGSTTFNLPGLHDCMPIGAGNLYTVAQSGGEATHVLSAAEMPVHGHSASLSGSGSGSTDAQGYHDHLGADNYAVNGTSSGTVSNVHTGSGNYVVFRSDTLPAVQGAGSHSHNVSVSVSVSGSTGNAGSGAAHNNLPPFKGVHFIIRAY